MTLQKSLINGKGWKIDKKLNSNLRSRKREKEKFEICCIERNYYAPCGL
jgi:hypothetical protein